VTDENPIANAQHPSLQGATDKAVEAAAAMTRHVTSTATNVTSEASKVASRTAEAVAKGAAAFGNKASKVATDAAILVGDLNGDGVVDAEDYKIARAHAASALSSAGDGLMVAGTVVGQEAGNLARSVVRTPLAKDVATYAAVGAAIALPLPVVGPAIGAAVGAALGLWRNMTRHETLVPEPRVDAVAELERLHGLKEKGILTEDEFLAQKRKFLS
jgi:hypothetical protein